MTEKERGGVEILVHTTAPSRGRDDAHYRALASAYLLFEPVNFPSLSDNNANSQFSASEVHVADRSCNSSPGSMSQGGRRGRGMVMDENFYDVSQSQDQASSRTHVGLLNADISLDSPQVSFSSVLDNLSSPALLRYERTVKTPPPSAKQETGHLGAENESSWKTPPSVIPDSQSPYNLLIPEYSSPTRILELYLQHFDTSGSVSVTNDASGASQEHEASSINLFLDSSQPQASSPPEMTPPHASFGIDESPQIIRDTPYAQHHERFTSPRLTRKITPSPKKAALSAEARSGFTRANRHHMPPPPAPTNSEIIPSPPRPTPQTSPQRKRRRVEVPATVTKPSQRKPSKLILPPRITPNEIHPPPPRTSCWGPKPPLIITPSLQVLATQLDLPRRYRPKTQTRALRHLERGYWAVETAEWPCVLRDQAWIALGTYLGQGRAGWGVWAVRGDHVWKNAAVGEERDQLGFRVYCWGGVAGHVYLLLYLVSQRRIKETGARWVDGGGEVVVRML